MLGELHGVIRLLRLRLVVGAEIWLLCVDHDLSFEGASLRLRWHEESQVLLLAHVELHLTLLRLDKVSVVAGDGKHHFMGGDRVCPIEEVWHLLAHRTLNDLDVFDLGLGGLNFDQVLLDNLLGIDVHRSHPRRVLVHVHGSHGYWHRLDGRSMLLQEVERSSAVLSEYKLGV